MTVSKRRIRIGKELFSLIYTDDLPGLYGHHKPRKKQLLIHNSQVLRDKQATEIHEILHEIFRQRSIKLQAGGVDVEEALVEALSYPILDLIQENPDFIEYLLENKE